MCSRLMLSTTSGSRAHSVTDSTPPLRASRSASAVPHAPPPTTAIFTSPAPVSRRHALSRPEPILRTIHQPPNVPPMRVPDQQGERHARPEGVRRARRGEPHPEREQRRRGERRRGDRKSTRLNSSHGYISYAVFCLKKKKKINI